jgi:hypothetical protein
MTGQTAEKTMSAKARVLLICSVLSFVIAAGRFAPAVPIPRDVEDFAGGLGVGLLLGVLVTWAADRTRPD